MGERISSVILFLRITPGAVAMEKYEFHFPQNLKSKPTILLWEVKDISVIIVGSMISFYFLLSRGFVLPSVFTAIYAIMTTRVNEYTILSGLVNALNYFLLESQEYDWEPAFQNAPKAKNRPQKKKKKPSQKKKKSHVDIAAARKRRESLVRIGFVAAALLLTSAASGWYLIQEKKEKAENILYSELSITFADTGIIEYGSGTVQSKSLIAESNGAVTADPETIDVSVPGTVSVTYTVSGKTEYGTEVSKKYQKEFEVADTQPPVIEIGSETVILSAGQKYDIHSNIKAVYDIVDGDLQLSDTLQYGTYMVTGSADLNKEGTYPVTVDACDRNGKNTTLIFFIEVRE